MAFHARIAHESEIRRAAHRSRSDALLRSRGVRPVDEAIGHITIGDTYAHQR